MVSHSRAASTVHALVVGKELVSEVEGLVVADEL